MRAIRSGCVQAVLGGVLVLGFAPVPASAQFSPGPLSKAHQSLEGPTHCASCHVGGRGDRKFRCLTCHVEIRQRLAEGRGWHPQLLQKGPAEDQCAKCHSDHNGVEFVPTRWDVSLDEFDHRKTGYPLDGGHAHLKCTDCHTPQRISAEARRGILMKNLKRTWLGLSRDCASCHKDEHRGQVGNACERCHATAKWKDTSRFHHADTRYPLTGAHSRAACQKCHVQLPANDGGKPYIKYTGLSFTQCTPCHDDPHRGAFTATCNSCHNDSAWKPARGTDTAFDHSKTKFPLLAKHAAVTCDKCHKTTNYKAPVAHELCGDCHKDVHNGQFATSAGGPECARCHTADGWKATAYTVAAHATSRYPLTGKHAVVECAACHKPAGRATRYRVAFQACSDCHKDPHEMQFASTPCENCHTVDHFRPARFTLTAHAKTRFPLTGAHSAVACSDCHTKRPERPTTIAYRFADLGCESCHQDPHGGQFRRGLAAKPSTAPAACLDCHTVVAWKDVSKFDHSTSRFPLTGGHRGVSCDGCHKATGLSADLRRVVFRSAPTACVGCHEDIHAGQFKSAGRQPECEACHNNTNWRAAAFDHNKTDFPLTGAHSRVPCRDCHKNKQELGGRMVLLYKPAPKDCAICHANTDHQ